MILFSAVEDALATTGCCVLTGVQFDFVLRIFASMPIGVRRMDDVKRIDQGILMRRSL